MQAKHIQNIQLCWQVKKNWDYVILIKFLFIDSLCLQRFL